MLPNVSPRDEVIRDKAGRHSISEVKAAWLWELSGGDVVFGDDLSSIGEGFSCTPSVQKACCLDKSGRRGGACRREVGIYKQGSITILQ